MVRACILPRQPDGNAVGLADAARHHDDVLALLKLFWKGLRGNLLDRILVPRVREDPPHAL
eukprot:6616273-Lingulodinium_polyedra.AAC.1